MLKRFIPGHAHWVDFKHYIQQLIREYKQLDCTHIMEASSGGGQVVDGIPWYPHHRGEGHSEA
jgi:hypothetical protein